MTVEGYTRADSKREADRVSDEIAEKVVRKMVHPAPVPKRPRSRRSSRFFAHAVEVFGDIAKDPKERVLRFLEEAVELAQAAGVDRNVVEKTVARVYARPPGVIAEEIGQSLVTLELVGIVFHVSPEDAADFQLRRFLSKPAEHWQERQAKKKALGITADAE